jgi:hypothetical protein
MTSTHGSITVPWNTSEDGVRLQAIHRSPRRTVKGMVLDYWAIYTGTTTVVSAWATKGAVHTIDPVITLLVVAGVATTETAPYADSTSKIIVSQLGFRNVLATGIITAGDILSKSVTYPGVATKSPINGLGYGFAISDETTTLAYRKNIRAIITPWRM